MIRRTKLLVAAAALAAVIVAIPWLIPAARLIPQIEAAASQRLGLPVTIGALRVFLLPLPHATAERIRIGGEAGAQIGRLRAWPALPELFSDVKVIREIRLDEVAAGQAFIERLASLPAADGPQRVRIERVVLNKGELRLSNVTLRDLSCDALIDEDGKVRTVRIDSEGRLRVEARPAERGTWALQVAARGWTPPLGPKLLFDRIDATIALRPEGMETRDLVARLYGGRAAGPLSIAWKPAWTVTGELTVEDVRLQPLAAAVANNRAISGRLTGKPRFEMRGKRPADLLPGLRLASDFRIEEGTLHKVDLVAAARNPLAQPAAGETRFDDLSGHLDIDPQGYHFTRLNVSSGLLRATGEVSVARDQRLEGRIDAELRGTASLIAVPLSVSGTVQDPALAPTRSAMAGAVAGSVLLPGIGTALGIKAGQLTERLFGKRREPAVAPNAASGTAPAR
jgi:hypothetical protein